MLYFLRKHPEVIVWFVMVMLTVSSVVYVAWDSRDAQKKTLESVVEECAELHGADYLGCKQQVTDRIENERRNQEGFFRAHN